MNKNYVWISVATILLLLSNLACNISVGPLSIGSSRVRGSGIEIMVERQVSDFDSINLSGIGRMFIEFGDQESLRVQAEDNIMPYIETEVRGGTLVISIKRRVNLQPTKPINYYLTVKQLESVTVSGAGNIEIEELTTDRFSINISGAGGIDIGNLEAENLGVLISGLGDLTINNGTVNFQEVDLSGSGNYDALGLESIEANVDLSGLGSASIWATGKLDVVISGVGSVQYKGDPVVNKDISGLGSISQIKE